MIGNPMPRRLVVHGFHVEQVGTEVAVWHPAQTSIVIILEMQPSSNFDTISALDFYLYPQSEDVTVEDVLYLFHVIKGICPENCHIVHLSM